MITLEHETYRRLRAIQKTNKDRRVYIKVTVLLMLHNGFSPSAISESLGIDDSTIYRYIQSFEEKGMEDYLKDNFVAYSGQLSAEEEVILRSELQAHLYINTKEVVSYILDKFNKSYSVSGVTKLLGRLGFVYKKTKSVGAKSNPAAQEAFVKEFESLLREKDEKSVVYFNDGVHPQHNTRADYGWIYQGQDFEIPSNPGRKRLNINGAINAQKVTDVVIVEAERINAQSCIELWKKQRKRHPGKTIYNICDNAPYYHSKIIKKWLEKHQWCQVIYLPPYAPNLNIIERLWKYLRRQVTSYIYYEHFDDFRQAILDFFSNIRDHKSALKSLLTLKFHIT